MKKKNMNPKTTLSISDARKDIFNIAEEVQKPNNYYTFTEKGRPKAVLMSAEDFDSWRETMEVMREFPDLDKDIKETDSAVKSGEYKKWSTLEDVMAKHGFVVADKSKIKYGMENTVQKKGRKRS
ncbi:type II toxin-antitoxin system Phd/YefM family antitoxin [Patescibacteria group bacterium]|nr:type II toxin-antitoxin system Phd/YefM family antitoxin [Patescibacteria group bacterium]MBU4458908.1 type II toxin-antitoxin system Phd/YefM family antitoxin [Patescibacteria group bacterium]